MTSDGRDGPADGARRGARAPGAAARHGTRLPARVRLDAPAVPGAARRARTAAGAGVPALRPAGTDALPVAVLRPAAADRLRGRHRRVGAARARAPPARPRLAADGRVPRPLRPLPLDRARRADVLRIRLGDAALRGRLHRRLPRQRRLPAAAPHRARGALARLPPRVRRRPDQAARRPRLAEPDRALLPPRDAADAEPAEPHGTSRAGLVAPPRGRRQPHRAADRADPAVPAPADRLHRGRRDDPHAGLADRDRQLRVAEPAHDRARLRRPRRPRRARGAPVRPRRPAPLRRPAAVLGRADHAGGGRAPRARLPARAQPALQPSADERRLQPLVPRQRVRRVRQRHP